MLPDLGIDEAKKDFPPVMPWREFAAWCRVDVEMFRGWVERGYIPTVKVGKHRLVNIVELVNQLQEQEK